MTVNGPSLVNSTDICAPNTPVSTRAPNPRSSSTTRSTSGSATGPGAAACQVGRRPLRASPYSVNWLTTSSGAATSEHDFSSSRMRSVHSFRASLAACASPSVWVTPTSASSPGSLIAPTTSPSTVTEARLTRCTTARMRLLLSDQGPELPGTGDDTGQGQRERLDGVGEVAQGPVLRPAVPGQALAAGLLRPRGRQDPRPVLDVVEDDRVRQVAGEQVDPALGRDVVDPGPQQVRPEPGDVREHGTAQLRLGGHVLRSDGHRRARDDQGEPGERG